LNKFTHSKLKIKGYDINPTVSAENNHMLYGSLIKKLYFLFYISISANIGYASFQLKSSTDIISLINLSSLAFWSPINDRLKIISFEY